MAGQAAAAKAAAPEAVNAHVHVVCARTRARGSQRRGLCLRVLRRYRRMLCERRALLIAAHLMQGRNTCLPCNKEGNQLCAPLSKGPTLTLAVASRMCWFEMSIHIPQLDRSSTNVPKSKDEI